MPITASNKSPRVLDILSKLQSGESLVGEDFSQQDLYGIALNQANLELVNFCQTILTNADLISANLKGAKLQNADLRGADLTGADLTGAYLSRADLRKANLKNANLQDAQFKVTIYDNETIFPEGFNYKTSGAIGPGASLNGAYLNTANLRGVDLSRAKMMGAYLSGADLTGAILDDVSLSGANLQKAILTGASLRNARLANSEFKGVDLRAADLTGANIENLQNIAGADFSMVKGLSDRDRASLLSFSAQDLSTWNSYTRCNTRDSLKIRE